MRIFHWFLVPMYREVVSALALLFAYLLLPLQNQIGGLILERAELGSMAMPAGATTTFEVEEARLLHSFELHLRGRLQITAGAANGTLVANNPQSYLSRLRIINTPRSVAADRIPKDLRGIDVYPLYQIYARQDPLRTQVAVGIGEHDFEVFLPIVFPPPDAPPGLKRQFLHPTNQFARTVIEATSLTAEALVSGGDRTKAMRAKEANTGDPEIVVTAVRVLNVDPRNYNPMVYKQKLLDFDIDVATANTEQRITTVSRGPIYRSLLLRQFLNDGVAEAQIDTGINGIEMQIDRKPAFFDWSDSSDTQGWKKAVRQGLEDRVPNNDQLGYIVMEFVTKEGKFNRALNTRQLIDAGLPLDLVLDAAGITNAALDIVSQEIVPALAVSPRSR